METTSEQQSEAPTGFGEAIRAAVEADPAMIERHPNLEPFSEHLKCELTDEEAGAIGREAAKLSQQIKREQLEEKERAKAARDKITGLVSKHEGMAQVSVQKWEMRDVACVIKYDLANRRRTIVRLDTGTILRVQTLTDAEVEKRARAESHWPTKSMRFYDPATGAKVFERAYTDQELRLEEANRQTVMPGTEGTGVSAFRVTMTQSPAQSSSALDRAVETHLPKLQQALEICERFSDQQADAQERKEAFQMARAAHEALEVAAPALFNNPPPKRNNAVAALRGWLETVVAHCASLIGEGEEASEQAEEGGAS